MSAQPQEFQPMTIEEFLAFEETHPEGRYEYIDGYVRDLGALLMAGGTNTHAAISVNISIALGNALRAGDRRCRAYSEAVYFRPNETTYFHPDVSASCDPRDLARNDAIESPCLVVEVLSPSTEAFDRSQKLRAYSECSSIQEYMLVDTTKRLIDVYHRLPNGRMEYRTYRKGDTITLSGLGVDVTVDSIYYDLTFE